MGTRAVEPAGFRASPVARRIAAERGVDLGDGRAAAVRDGSRRRTCSPGSSETAADPVPTPEAPPGGTTASRVGKLNRTQKLIARRMADTKATVPNFQVTMAVDMSAVTDLRRAMRRISSGCGPSFTERFVVKAAALALRAHPRINGSYVDGRFELHER